MITDVEGVRVGHWTAPDGHTGCTVVRLPEGAVASGEFRGGAPATRDAVLLAPDKTVARLDAVCCHRPRQLCGAAGQLRPGEGDVAVDHPRVVAIARRHLGEQRRGGLRSGYIACKRVICWVL